MFGKTDFRKHLKRLSLATKNRLHHYILRQTACMVVDPLMVDIIPLKLLDGRSVLRLNDESFQNLFQMVGARLPMSVRAHSVPVCGFLVFWLHIVITVGLII